MRNARALGVSLAVLALAGTAQAQQQERRFNPVATIIQLDANGDQTIERDEVPESGRDAFETLLKAGDENKNGKLEQQEIRGLLQKLQAEGNRGAERFKAMDKDEDGKISKEEFEGPAPLFGRLDADNDGFITREEGARFALANRPEAAGMDRFKAMDKDGDGKVSKEEFPGRAPLFDRLDTNKDGFIQPGEMPGALGHWPARAGGTRAAATAAGDGQGRGWQDQQGRVPGTSRPLRPARHEQGRRPLPRGSTRRPTGPREQLSHVPDCGTETRGPVVCGRGRVLRFSGHRENPFRVTRVCRVTFQGTIAEPFFGRPVPLL